MNGKNTENQNIENFKIDNIPDNETHKNELSNNKKIWFNILIIFLFGNIVIGLFESFTFDKIYVYTQLNSKNLDYIARFIIVLGHTIISTIALSYVIFSFIVLYKDTTIVRHKKTLKRFLIFYYVTCILTFSLMKYSSPISYFSSLIYTGITYGDFSKDIIKLQNYKYLDGDN